MQVLDPVDRHAAPVRTWRPMLLWTAGMLLALGLVWFAGAVAVPYWQAREVLRWLQMPQDIGDRSFALKELGGSGAALRKVSVFLRVGRHTRKELVNAAWLLGGCRDEEAVPLLLKLAGSDDLAVRFAALGNLGHCYPEDQRTGQALVAILLDRRTEEGLRVHAAECMAGQTGPEAVAALVAALADESEEVSRAAGSALRAIHIRTGQCAPSCIADVKRLLDHRLAHVRRNAAECLEEFGAGETRP